MTDESGQCQVEECYQPAVHSGLCYGHYAEWREIAGPEPAEPTVDIEALGTVHRKAVLSESTIGVSLKYVRKARQTAQRAGLTELYNELDSTADTLVTVHASLRRVRHQAERAMNKDEQFNRRAEVSDLANLTYGGRVPRKDGCE